MSLFKTMIIELLSVFTGPLIKPFKQPETQTASTFHRTSLIVKMFTLVLPLVIDHFSSTVCNAKMIQR